MFVYLFCGLFFFLCLFLQATTSQRRIEAYQYCDRGTRWLVVCSSGRDKSFCLCCVYAPVFFASVLLSLCVTKLRDSSYSLVIPFLFTMVWRWWKVERHWDHVGARQRYKDWTRKQELGFILKILKMYMLK